MNELAEEAAPGYWQRSTICGSEWWWRSHFNQIQNGKLDLCLLWVHSKCNFNFNLSRVD